MNSAKRLIGVVGGYTILFILLVELIYYIGHGRTIGSSALVRFDAEHYQSIANNGYVHFRQAFFPLFPLVWRWLHLTPISASVLNIICYFVGVTWLSWTLGVRLNTLVIFLALPSALFFYVPYTESFYFLFATILLVGLYNNKWWIVLCGLFLCTLTRPAFTTLLPALLLAVGLNEGRAMTFVQKALSALVITACGLILVIMVQSYYTGELFGFYTAQQSWGNKPILPAFPLSSWGGNDVVRLDATALLIGILCGIFLIYYILHLNRNTQCTIRPELTVSISAIFFITVLPFFLHGGELFSLNRFIFSTPFCLVLIHHISAIFYIRSWAHSAILIFALIVFFLLFGSFVHIQFFLSFVAVACFVIAVIYSLNSDKSPPKWFSVITWIVMVVIQLYFTLKFLDGGWVA
jgi:hypothetical protein